MQRDSRDEDLSDRWVEESVAWMESHKNKPFFLFFSSHDLHVPRVVHERFQGSSGLGPRGDAIVELDWCVGELTKTLDRLQLTEKTLVVFCSDNGPVLDDGYMDQAIEKLGSHRPAGPFRGGKYNVYEAGTRTPFITRWPGVIPPGTSDAMVCTIDLVASLAAHTGADLPVDGCLDSINVMSALLGKDGAPGRESLVQQDNGQSGTLGFRSGKWKLQKTPNGRARNVGLRLQAMQVDEYQLFDLENDPRETENVLEDYPEVGKALIRQLDELVTAGRSRPAN